MQARTCVRSREKGVALVTVALLGLAVIPMIGLAVDGAVVYLLRAKLSRAVDAAVLAGARSLSRGEDIDSQRGNAIAVAQSYFDANFPTGDWGSINCVRTAGVGQDDATRVRWVTVTASVDARLYFMPALNRDLAHISVNAQARRRDVNIVLVLDRSGSMVRGMDGNAIPRMRDAAKAFVQKFASGRDKVGLITFGGNYVIAYRPSVNFKTDTPGVLGSLDIMGVDGNTGTAQALWKAYNELQGLNEPGALNVILLFTDGLPNGITADFQPYLSAVSGCLNPGTPKIGYLARSTIGTLWGIVNPVAASLTDVSEYTPAPNSEGCLWSWGVSDGWLVQQAITRLPDHDVYGNSTANGYRPVNLFGLDWWDMDAASANAADDAARRIRRDAALNPYLYVIGLGGTSVEPPDQDFMRRIANDPSSASYTTAEPTGLYVWSPTSEQLQSSFLRIASEILRLAQ